MAESVVASNVGITEAGQSLLNCANELSDLFDNVAQVTDSLGANVTGFSSIEELVSQLKNINSTKDSLISKIKEFGNYLTSTVTTGYDAFAEAIGKINVDMSSLSTLVAMLSGKTLGGNTFDSEGITENSGTQSGVTEGDSDGSVDNYGGDNMGVTGQELSENTEKKSFSDGLYHYNVTEDGRTLHWGGGITVDGKRIPLYVDENGNQYYLDDSGNEVYLNSLTRYI